MNRLSWKLALSALVFLTPARAALADPEGLKTLAIGSPAPDFKLPGSRRQNLQPRRFRPEQDLVRHFHLQSLPDRPGLRRTPRPP